MEGSSHNAVSLAISNALESNMALQRELKRRVEKLRQLQLQNRLCAAEVTRSLSLLMKLEPQHIFSQECSLQSTEDGMKDDDADHESKEQQTVTESTPRLDFNPNRKWTRHFFVDERGSTPNALTLEAASVESNSNIALDGRKDQINLQVAWSKADVANLQKVTDEALQKVGVAKSEKKAEDKDYSKAIPWNNKAFFEEVASNLDTSPHRSADECRRALLTFADKNIINTKFLKEESLFILREIAQSDEEDIDWYELTSRLNVNFYSDHKRRTPWQCFKHYRSSLRDSTKTAPWTAEEDELLLKYIAAHGPRFVFGDSAISQACEKLFPLNEPKLVQQRAHATLVNPNFVQDRWDINDQRKLALLMRAYSDGENTFPNQEHFPHRAQTRVISKWERSLNPAVSCKPFTAAEDKKLLAAVREMESDNKTFLFVSVAKQFPGRSSNTLWHRWTQLADERDIISKLNNRYIKKNFGKKHLLGNADGMMSTDDFVVQKKKKPNI